MLRCAASQELHPSKGKGIKRTACDSMTLLKRHVSITETKKSAKLVMMYEEQWMKLARDVLVIPVHEALVRWDSTKALTPESETGQKGLEKSRLHIPMNSEDSVTFSSISQVEQAVMLEAKKKKIKDEQMVVDAIKEIMTGHESFADALCSKTGGALAAGLAALGSSSMLTAGGGGSFSGAAASNVDGGGSAGGGLFMR